MEHPNKPARKTKRQPPKTARRNPHPLELDAPDIFVLEDASERRRRGLICTHETFSAVYQMEPLERVEIIKSGVEPESFALIAQAMHRSKESFGQLMGLSVTTVDRKAQKGERLTADQSERLVGAAKLIGQVQAMVEESGNPDGFNAAQWLDEWLDRPLSALSDRPPAELMSTAEGRELLSRLLATAQSGTYV